MRAGLWACICVYSQINAVFIKYSAQCWRFSTVLCCLLCIVLCLRLHSGTGSSLERGEVSVS